MYAQTKILYLLEQLIQLATRCVVASQLASNPALESLVRRSYKWDEWCSAVDAASTLVRRVVWGWSLSPFVRSIPSKVPVLLDPRAPTWRALWLLLDQVRARALRHTARHTHDAYVPRLDKDLASHPHLCNAAAIRALPTVSLGTTRLMMGIAKRLRISEPVPARIFYECGVTATDAQILHVLNMWFRCGRGRRQTTKSIIKHLSPTAVLLCRTYTQQWRAKQGQRYVRIPLPNHIREAQLAALHRRYNVPKGRPLPCIAGYSLACEDGDCASSKVYIMGARGHTRQQMSRGPSPSSYINTVHSTACDLAALRVPGVPVWASPNIVVGAEYCVNDKGVTTPIPQKGWGPEVVCSPDTVATARSAEAKTLSQHISARHAELFVDATVAICTSCMGIEVGGECPDCKGDILHLYCSDDPAEAYAAAKRPAMHPGKKLKLVDCVGFIRVVGRTAHTICTVCGCFTRYAAFEAAGGPKGDGLPVCVLCQRVKATLSVMRMAWGEVAIPWVYEMSPPPLITPTGWRFVDPGTDPETKCAVCRQRIFHSAHHMAYIYDAPDDAIRRAPICPYCIRAPLTFGNAHVPTTGEVWTAKQRGRAASGPWVSGSTFIVR